MFSMFIEKYRKICVLAFFIAYFLVGITIFKDYGISWDEHLQNRAGTVSLLYALGSSKELLTHGDKYHGAAFEMILVGVETILNPFNNSRFKYLSRHLMIFSLFFISIIFFYKLCKRLFGDWRIGLLGSLFLILSPRIFAHSFYNSKDIAFLSSFIFAIYTLILFLDRKTIKAGLFHSLTCAFLIDIRITGIIVPFITIFIFWLELWFVKQDKVGLLKGIGIISSYIFFLIIFTILFWPILWTNPVHHFISAFKEMSHYPWKGKVLYLGKYWTDGATPWHYIPVWIAISMPLSYLVSFLIGLFVLIRKFFEGHSSYLDKRTNLILLIWLMLPLSSVIFLRSVLYDEWRHLFFIYPAIIIVALIGIKDLFRYIKIRFQGLRRKVIISTLVFFIVFDLSHVVYFMVKYHPFQNIYFNILAGANRKNIKNNFELDYWGLSYRKALEYILANDPRQVLKIHVANSPGETNANILSRKEKNRIFFTKDLDQADYFVSNYRGSEEEYPFRNEYYSITVDGLKIMVVYKLKD